MHKRLQSVLRCAGDDDEGIGKGVIDAVALPVSGAIDFGGHAFETVHRYVLRYRHVSAF